MKAATRAAAASRITATTAGSDGKSAVSQRPCRPLARSVIRDLRSCSATNANLAWSEAVSALPNKLLAGLRQRQTKTIQPERQRLTPQRLAGIGAGVASTHAAEANLIAFRVLVGHLGRAVVVRLALRGLDAPPGDLGDPVVEVVDE